MRAAILLTIRRAGAEDARAIASVLYESFAEFRALYTDGGFAATALGAEQILIRMQEGPVWVALREDAVVGTVAAVARGESVYVRGMAVVPAARGLGAGAALLRTVESWAVREGFGRLFLSSTPFLSSAIQLYERFGFRRVEEEPQNLFGTALFTMEKMVGGSAGCSGPGVRVQR
ncbi:MAG: GNAT family N-acetyltransferase [Candidatus Sulfotelmatobacter sp.]